MNYSTVKQIIETKYNISRLLLYQCIMHHLAYQRHYNEYKAFLKFLEKKFPLFVDMYLHQIPIIVANSRDDINTIMKTNPKLPPNIKFVLTQSVYFQYVAIKCILSRIFIYEKLLSAYLSYIESAIMNIYNSLVGFRNFYSYFISITVMNSNNDDNDLINKHLQQIKQKILFSEGAFKIRNG